jgi:hypothetical protein
MGTNTNLYSQRVSMWYFRVSIVVVSLQSRFLQLTLIWDTIFSNGKFRVLPNFPLQTPTPHFFTCTRQRSQIIWPDLHIVIGGRAVSMQTGHSTALRTCSMKFGGVEDSLSLQYQCKIEHASIHLLHTTYIIPLHSINIYSLNILNTETSYFILNCKYSGRQLTHHFVVQLQP